MSFSLSVRRASLTVSFSISDVVDLIFSLMDWVSKSSISRLIFPSRSAYASIGVSALAKAPTSVNTAVATNPIGPARARALTPMTFISAIDAAIFGTRTPNAVASDLIDFDQVNTVVNTLTAAKLAINPVTTSILFPRKITTSTAEEKTLMSKLPISVNPSLNSSD